MATCLVVLAVVAGLEIRTQAAARREAEQQLRVAQEKIARLEASNALTSLRLSALEAKDPAYAGARVFVAWDAMEHRGSIALENLPPTPAGRDYQLWVLDPNAPGPVSAGVVTGARTFAAGSCSMPQPGFAISLEPSGGSPSLMGPILFAVAPAE